MSQKYSVKIGGKEISKITEFKIDSHLKQLLEQGVSIDINVDINDNNAKTPKHGDTVEVEGVLCTIVRVINDSDKSVFTIQKKFLI